MNIRKHWHFGEKYIGLELSGFTSTPSIGFESNGDEGEIMFNLCGGIGIYITLNGFLPNKWYPKDWSQTYGWLPGRREISLRFHHWSFWWTFWKDTDSWSNTDSKWKSGSFDFARFFMGRHTCNWTEIRKEMRIVSMPEGNYSVEVVQRQRIDSWERWFTKKSISWDVRVGYYENDKFVKRSIPIEGKGENSWDQGEDGTYSMSFPDRRYGSFTNALLYFESEIKKDRIKRGGKNWMPESFRGQPLETIK